MGFFEAAPHGGSGGLPNEIWTRRQPFKHKPINSRPMPALTALLRTAYAVKRARRTYRSGITKLYDEVNRERQLKRMRTLRSDIGDDGFQGNRASRKAGRLAHAAAVAAYTQAGSPKGTKPASLESFQRVFGPIYVGSTFDTRRGDGPIIGWELSTADFANLSGVCESTVKAVFRWLVVGDVQDDTRAVVGSGAGWVAVHARRGWTEFPSGARRGLGRVAPQGAPENGAPETFECIRTAFRVLAEPALLAMRLMRLAHHFCRPVVEWMFDQATRHLRAERAAARDSQASLRLLPPPQAPP